MTVWWKERREERGAEAPPRQRRIDLYGVPRLTAPAIRMAPVAGMLSGGFMYGGELTIADGLVTRTAPLHDIDTEADAASDALVGAQGGTEGALLIIWANHTDRTIVVHHNESGGESVDGTRFILAGSADVSITATGLAMAFVYVTALDSGKGAWQETGHAKYTDAEAVSTVATADDYLKNDANDETTGDLTVANLVTAGDVDGVDVSALDTAVVKKALFDAQTILAAVNDDDPAALALAEQRLVGRLTGGNVAAITIGMADDNIPQVDATAGVPNDDELARWTASGLEGRTAAQALADIAAQGTAAKNAANGYAGLTAGSRIDPTQTAEKRVSITVETPTASEDITICRFNVAVTITKVVGVLVGYTSVTINPKHHTDRNNAGTALLDAATAITSTTTGDVLTTWTDENLAADEFLWLETTAKTGTTGHLHLTIFYTED